MKQNEKPNRTWNLLDCEDCSRNYSENKVCCFSLTFPDATVYLCGSSDEEVTEWINLIKWKMVSLKTKTIYICLPYKHNAYIT